MCSTFPENKRIIMFRHPCAVVSSLMRARGDWSHWEHDDVVLPLRRMFGDVIDSIHDQFGSPEELLAASWAADVVAVLAETTPKDTLLLTYEEMSRDPSTTLDRLFGYLNEPVPPGAAESVARPSETSNSDSAIRERKDPIRAWTGKLTDAAVRRILNVTRRFGINFYDTNPEPDLWILRQAHEETTRIMIDTKTGHRLR